MEYKVINKPGDNSRYIVVDLSGKVIDDAQGWGFKSKQGAISSIKYKQSHPDHRKYKKYIKELYLKYKELEIITDDISDWIFYEIKDVGSSPSKKHIENKILKRIRLEVPELWKEFENDDELKYFFLKSL